MIKKIKSEMVYKNQKVILTIQFNGVDNAFTAIYSYENIKDLVELREFKDLFAYLNKEIVPKALFTQISFILTESEYYLHGHIEDYNIVDALKIKKLANDLLDILEFYNNKR